MNIIPSFRLVRIEDHEAYGMLGVLTMSGNIFCATLEPPDFGNAQNISCIPEGQYTLERYSSNRFERELMRLRNVPNRSSVAIHSGRIVEHTHGCILIGSHWEKLATEKRELANSGQTLERFMLALREHQTAHITITSNF